MTPLIGPARPADTGRWPAAKAEPNWLVYHLAPRDGGKLAKVPTDPRTGKVTSVHSAACLTFADAELLAAAKLDRGIGYLPRRGSTLIGIDLDGAIADGVVSPWADELLRMGASWAEISPSGRGIRIIARRLGAPERMRERNGLGYYGSASRFFTVTLNLLQGRRPVLCAAPFLVRTVLARLDCLTTGYTRMPRGHDLASCWFDKLPPSRQDAEVKRMLAHLRDPKFGNYEEWLRVSLAVYRATDSMGFNIWDNWCQGLPNYNAAENYYKWSTFATARPNGIGVGTLIWLAREHGYRLPEKAIARARHSRFRQRLATIEGVAR